MRGVKLEKLRVAGRTFGGRCFVMGGGEEEEGFDEPHEAGGDEDNI